MTGGQLVVRECVGAEPLGGFAHLLLGEHGQLGQVVETADILGAEAGAGEPVAVVGHRRNGVGNRLPQTFVAPGDHSLVVPEATFLVFLEEHLETGFEARASDAPSFEGDGQVLQGDRQFVVESFPINALTQPPARLSSQSAA